MRYALYHKPSGHIAAQIDIDPSLISEYEDEEVGAFAGSCDPMLDYMSPSGIAVRENVTLPEYRELVAASNEPQLIMAGLPDHCWVRIAPTGRMNFAEETVEVVGSALTFALREAGTYSITLQGRFEGGPWLIRATGLAEMRQERNDRVTALKSQIQAGGFQWRGRRWDADSEGRLNLTSIVAGVKAGIPLPAGFYWTSADNEDVEMTPDDLVDFATTMLHFVNAVHGRNRSLKQMIEGASSVDEILEIDVETGWPT